MKEIRLDSWSQFKDICIKKKELNIQYINLGKEGDYQVFAVEEPLFWFVELVAEDDIKDFESKYKKKANGRIKP